LRLRQGFFYREAREFSEREKSIPAMKGETSTSVCSSSSSRQMARLPQDTRRAWRRSGFVLLLSLFVSFMFLRYHGRLANARIFFIFFRVRFDLFNSRARPSVAPIRKRARPGIAPISKRAKYFPRKLLNAKALRAPGAPKSLILRDLRTLVRIRSPPQTRILCQLASA
jgi:hypothetical protein